MANNKVQLANGTVLIDLTSDTVDAEHLAQGYTAHDRSGAAITGTMTGGGLGLTVTGGTTRPASPAANTIWVNTSTAIGNWYVQNTAPTSPSAGDVWITLKPSLTNLINLSDSGSFMVGFGRTQQFVSGAWVDKDAELYDGSSWSELQTYAYNLGDQCSETTGGWEHYKAGNNCLDTFEETYLNHDYKSTTAYRGVFITEQQIDVTEFTKIHMDYEITSAGNTGSNYVGGLFFTTNTGSITNAENASTGLITFHVSSRARTVDEFDITNFTGNYYIMTRQNYQKWKCYRIWLTK